MINHVEGKSEKGFQLQRQFSFDWWETGDVAQTYSGLNLFRGHVIDSTISCQIPITQLGITIFYYTCSKHMTLRSHAYENCAWFRCCWHLLHESLTASNKANFGRNYVPLAEWTHSSKWSMVQIIFSWQRVLILWVVNLRCLRSMLEHNKLPM